MGKIKLRLIRRTAGELIKKGIEFSNSFEENKKILAGTMPSKKIRNQVAGLIAKMKKREKEQLMLNKQ